MKELLQKLFTKNIYIYIHKTLLMITEKKK